MRLNNLTMILRFYKRIDLDVDEENERNRHTYGRKIKHDIEIMRSLFEADEPFYPILAVGRLIELDKDFISSELTMPSTNRSDSFINQYPTFSVGYQKRILSFFIIYSEKTS